MSEAPHHSPSQSQQPDHDAALFPVLAPEQIAQIAPYGTEVHLETGEIAFEEGQPEDSFFVIREGRLKVTRTVEGSEVVLVIHNPGQFTGALSLLTGEKSIATGSALGSTHLQRFSVDNFRRMLVECPEIASKILSCMAARRPVADTMILEREKLASLGKMAAGLAHELNNPASAAQRASGDLRRTLIELQKQTAILVCLVPTTTWETLESLITDTGARPRSSSIRIASVAACTACLVAE